MTYNTQILHRKRKSKCLVDCIMYNTQILNRKRNQNVQYTDTEQKKKSKCLVDTDQDNERSQDKISIIH